MVVTRFRVPVPAGEHFEAELQQAVDILSAKDGFVGADVGRNLDEPELWVLVTRWVNVGSYRRALSGIESKMVVVPLLSRCIDEASAYDRPGEDSLNPPRSG